MVRRNNIYDGKSAGIFVFDHGRGIIENNNIYGNASSGIEVARGMDEKENNKQQKKKKKKNKIIESAVC